MSEWPKPEAGEVCCNEVGDIYIPEGTPVVVVSREQWSAMVAYIKAANTAHLVAAAFIRKEATHDDLMDVRRTMADAYYALDAGLGGRDLGDVV